MMTEIEFNATDTQGRNIWEIVISAPDGYPIPLIGDWVSMSVDGCGCDDAHKFVVADRTHALDDEDQLGRIVIGIEPSMVDGDEWADEAHLAVMRTLALKHAEFLKEAIRDPR